MKNKDDKFKFFVPIDTIEKAKNKKGEEVMKIRGIASDSKIDEDEEYLDPSGFDLNYFKDSGFLNWNHMAKKNPRYYIGEPTIAKITNDNEFYVEGDLWSESEMAKDVYNLAQLLEKRRKEGKTKKRMGFSIEGKKTEVDPINPKRVRKAQITGLALTIQPKNSGTWAEIMKGNFTDEEYEYEDDNENNKEEKYDANGGQTYILDVTKDNGDRIVIDKDFNIQVIGKALTTQSGAALKRESLEGAIKYPKEITKAIIIVSKALEKGLINKELRNKIRDRVKEKLGL